MTETAQRPPDQPWVAAGLMAGAMLCFVSLDSILKALVVEHGVGMLVTVRNLVQVVLLAAIAPFFGPGMLRTRQLPLHMARGLCVVATTVLVTLSLAHLPMTQTYAITFSAPLIASLLAAFFLQERPGVAQWALILAGFAGVLVALGPGTPSFGPALLFPLGMAAANAIYHVLTRVAGRTEAAMTLAFWGGAVALMWCLLALPMLYAPLPPKAIGLLVVGGAFGTLAQLLAAAAFKRAPTATVSPILYTQIVWAGIVGYLVFNEVPPLGTVIGGAIVTASGIALVRLSARKA